jgi:hypothetical protein
MMVRSLYVFDAWRGRPLEIIDRRGQGSGQLQIGSAQESGANAGDAACALT